MFCNMGQGGGEVGKFFLQQTLIKVKKVVFAYVFGATRIKNQCANIQSYVQCTWGEDLGRGSGCLFPPFLAALEVFLCSLCFPLNTTKHNYYLLVDKFG